MNSCHCLKLDMKGNVSETVEKIKSFLNTDKELFASFKFDGCSIKTTFDKDFNVTSILSRGGVNVTEKLKGLIKVQNDYVVFQKFLTPLLKSDIEDTLTVCCELVCENLIFSEHFENTYKNPRNLVGSLINKKEIDDNILNNLTTIPLTNGVNSP